MAAPENRQLVERLKQHGFITSTRVEKAFLAVDRGLFVPEQMRSYAYEDAALPIGNGQTISAPSIVAVMTQSLELLPRMRVLEVGTGSGYQAAILSRAVGARGVVYSIERQPELHARAKQILSEIGASNVRLALADGSQGLKEKAPFDRIVVTAATPAVPKPLFEQLKESGLMVLPLGGRSVQELVRVRREAGKMLADSILPVVFVPLLGKYGFKAP